MYKLFRFSFLVAIFAIALYSCGGGTSSPTDTAKKVCNAMVKKDATTFVKYLYYEDELDADQMSQIKALLAWQQPAKFEITGEEISSDGETARVNVKFTNKDGTVEDTNLKFTKTSKGWKVNM